MARYEAQGRREWIDIASKWEYDLRREIKWRLEWKTAVCFSFLIIVNLANGEVLNDHAVRTRDISWGSSNNTSARTQISQISDDWQAPPRSRSVLRKMSDDPGEMFMLSDWTFAETISPPQVNLTRSDSMAGEDNYKRKTTKAKRRNGIVLDRMSGDISRHDAGFDAVAQPALRPFADPQKPHLWRIAGRRILPSSWSSALLSRDSPVFTCPEHTNTCAAAGSSVTCCYEGQTCQSLSNQQIGCCAAGLSCSPSIAQCPQDYHSCPDNIGGGCCPTNAACVPQGCINNQVDTVTLMPTVTTITQNPDQYRSTATAIVILTSTVTAYPSVLPLSPSLSSPSDSSSQNTPGVLIPPIRPMSGSAVTSTTITVTTSPTLLASDCPTGFYACSAQYVGGCCRVGRDCSSTSCPAALTSTVFVNGNGVAIGAPVTATASSVSSASGDGALGQNSCAVGWYKCSGAASGSGCCPSGYACGESCTATNVNTAAGSASNVQVAKQNHASARSSRLNNAIIAVVAILTHGQIFPTIAIIMPWVVVNL